MKHPSKMTVTLSMVWIGAMGLLSNPRWLREFMDYVGKVTAHTPATTTASGGAGGSATRK
jgi:hypothetical protein